MKQRLVGLGQRREGRRELALEDGQQGEDDAADDRVELLDNRLERVGDELGERLSADGRAAGELLAKGIADLKRGVSEREAERLARVERRADLNGRDGRTNRARRRRRKEDRVRERRVDERRKEDRLESGGAGDGGRTRGGVSALLHL